MKEFSDAIFAGVSHSGGIWNFFDSWYSALLDPDVDVLWIFFEDLKADLEAQVRKIADFIGLKGVLESSEGDGPIEERFEVRIKVAVSQSKHSFMKVESSEGDGPIEERFEVRIKVAVSQSKHSFMKVQ
eukprot:CAMPEP_0204876514 /NCGR_PEP_ID=MMETSP1348-20121228/47682_1 /ASSEMBLY_ACC=CAM_ASM_000700 /TAXON_ID=215587 /ORGANISM="Aplanochytrium stocchinoi, Strain GSBS06" /LENGTH=128 /DNA_ID=CAMNT_0052033289 /DNA_START=565 /DNA_END=951 /DNA_ORIENTATION=-